MAHGTRSPLASHRPRRGRPAGARDRRASPLRPARILSLRPPNRPSQSQRKHLESNLEGGRKTDRQRGRSGRRRRCWKGREGIDPVRPSAPPLKAPPKKSNSQRATFFRSHVNDRRRGVWPARSLACEWRSRRGDGRTDNGRDAACLPVRPAVPLLITRKPITPIRERKTFHLNSDCLSP